MLGELPGRASEDTVSDTVDRLLVLGEDADAAVWKALATSLLIQLASCNKSIIERMAWLEEEISKTSEHTDPNRWSTDTGTGRATSKHVGTPSQPQGHHRGALGQNHHEQQEHISKERRSNTTGLDESIEAWPIVPVSSQSEVLQPETVSRSSHGRAHVSTRSSSSREPASNMWHKKLHISHKGGIHAVLAIQATKMDASLFQGLCSSALSNILVLLQILISYAIVHEASHPACTKHTQCRDGEFCSPTARPTRETFDAIAAGRWSGMCTDCYVVKHLQLWKCLTDASDTAKASDCWKQAWHQIPGSRFADPGGSTFNHWFQFSSAQMDHCNSTDVMNNACDYLVDSRVRLVVPALLTLFGVTLLVCQGLVGELDEAGDEWDLFEHRWGKQHRSHWSVKTLMWCSTSLRRFTLPAAVIGAFGALIFSAPLTSMGIILNGLAIGFMCTFDDIAALMSSRGEYTHLIDEAFENMDSDIKDGGVPVASQICGPVFKTSEFFHRAFVLTLGVSLFFAVLFPEPFLKNADLFYEQGLAVCSNVVDILYFVPMGIVLIAALLDASWRLFKMDRNAWCKDMATVLDATLAIAMPFCVSFGVLAATNEVLYQLRTSVGSVR